MILNRTELHGELNPLFSSAGFEDESNTGRVLVLAGWEQNPDLLQASMLVLAENGLQVAGWSAFDSIDATLAEEAIDLETYNLGMLAENYPRRMILRSLRLLTAFRDIPDILGVDVPDVAITHCAGANVFALASYLAKRNPMYGVHMPTHWLAVEPMLPSYASGFDFAKEQFAPFERRAKKDPALIRLKSLAHPDVPDLGANRSLPLSDIVRSEGLWLFDQYLLSENEVRALVSEQDYAAPSEPLEERLGADRVLSYHDQQRYGHGYMMAEPELAGRQIAHILRASSWFEEQ